MINFKSNISNTIFIQQTLINFRKLFVASILKLCLLDVAIPDMHISLFCQILMTTVPPPCFSNMITDIRYVIFMSNAFSSDFHKTVYSGCSKIKFYRVFCVHQICKAYCRVICMQFHLLAINDTSNKSP
jgi:hypothetical protein